MSENALSAMSNGGGPPEVLPAKSHFGHPPIISSSNLRPCRPELRTKTALDTRKDLH